MRRLARLAALLTLFALGTLALGGCCPLLTPVDHQPDDSTGSTAPTLETYLDASVKTGDFTTSSTWANGQTVEQSGTFWINGRLFRVDIYEEGQLIRSIISPDGESAYFAQHTNRVCEPSVASVNHYLREFTKPKAAGVSDGIDNETGAERIRYVVQELSDTAGASNPWHTEDITYLVKDGTVIGVITRGAVPKDDGSIGDLDVTRRMISNVTLGADIPPDTFVLPYEVKDAE